MGAGAVIHVTGKRKMTDLQGRNLFRKMPITLALYMVGAFSISAVPLFNGFVSKTMVVAAAGKLDRPAIELMLHLASIGTFLSVGLKLPWGTWFGKPDAKLDEISPAKEPPINMLLAMGLTAFLCIFTGIYPKPMYDLLPYAVDFHPYEASLVVAALQLLLLTAAAFWIFIDKLMAGKPAVSLDTDWFYRMLGQALFRFCNFPLQRFSNSLRSFTTGGTARLADFSRNPLTVLEMLWHKLQGKAMPDKYPAGLIHPANNRPFPIGWGVCVSILFLFFYGLVYLRLSTFF
jgi:multicomponent Na+:H+ antiporter subunit D